MKLDLVVRSERVVTPQGVRRGAVHIRRGRIAAVTDWESVPAGCPLYDAGRAVVMAGLIDSHVHINEPGRTSWEGFSSATRAAAAGGVTTSGDDHVTGAQGQAPRRPRALPCGRGILGRRGARQHCGASPAARCRSFWLQMFSGALGRCGIWARRGTRSPRRTARARAPRLSAARARGIAGADRGRGCASCAS